MGTIGFVCLLINAVFLATGPKPAHEQQLTEYADYSQIANFVNDDLLQGLLPDSEGGACPTGTYLTGVFAGDAANGQDPGALADPLDQCGWPHMPAYLVYSFPCGHDIREIRVTAAMGQGDYETGGSTAAHGDLALGIRRKTNPQGQAPVRPTENAIEVMHQDETVWTPLVPDIVESGRRTKAKSLWQGVWRWPAPVRHVRKIKFTLGPTVVHGGHGQITRIAEIDVLGRPSTCPPPPCRRLIRATNPCLSWSGFVDHEGSTRDALLIAWSGSGWIGRFRSKTCCLRFAFPTGSEYWIKVDDAPFRYAAMACELDLTPWLDKSRATHRVEVIKRSEIAYGSDAFLGMAIDADGILLPVEPQIAPGEPHRRILVLGDSITVGMRAGVPGDTDFRRSYGYLLGQCFNADVRLIARSGIGVYRGWYHVLFGTTWRQAVSPRGDRWPTENPLANWQPDLILVNLGTNDSSRGVKPQEFTPAMKALLLEVSAACPNAKLAVIVPWNCGCYRDDLRVLIDELVADGHQQFHFIDAQPNSWVPEGGMADNTHPNGKGHLYATAKLVPLIEKLTGWPAGELSLPCEPLYPDNTAK